MQSVYCLNINVQQQEKYRDGKQLGWMGCEKESTFTDLRMEGATSQQHHKPLFPNLFPFPIHAHLILMFTQPKTTSLICYSTTFIQLEPLGWCAWHTKKREINWTNQPIRQPHLFKRHTICIAHRSQSSTSTCWYLTQNNFFCKGIIVI